MGRKEGERGLNAQQRRQTILQILQNTDVPVSATVLANTVQVSRQSVVGDIALLRAAHIPILATPRGYVLQKADTTPSPYGWTHSLVCRHGYEQMEQELLIVVDNGGGILDVTIEHPVYREITGKLNLFSRHDVQNFIQHLSRGQALPLSRLTDGVHRHTICCRTQADYERIVHALRAAGILVQEPQ